MDEYSFNRLDEETYHCLQELYLKSFGLKETISFIRNKYDTAYTGVKNIGYTAFDQKGTPSAYYGVFPMILTAEGEDILVAQSGDTMTAPDHRGKGLFIKLAQRAYQLAWELDVKVVFGFPNENSFPGFKKKLNWEFHDFMQRFTITNPALPLCEISSTSKILSRLYQSYAKLILKRFKITLTEKDTDEFKDPKSIACIKKDIHFFNYKLSNPKNFLIRINGFSLLIKTDPHLLIGAVNYFEADRVPDFLSTIRKLALMLGCKKSQITISRNLWLYEYLTPFHKPEDSLPIGFLQPVRTVPVEQIAFTLADYDTF